MPKLLCFLPCEKVIIDQNANTISMINVLEGISVPKAPTPDAGVLLTWSIVSVWEQTEGDARKTYEQRTYLLLPDGKEKVDLITRFQFAQKRHRLIGTINGFPVPLAGDYILKLFLRELGSEQWIPIADYTLPVEHTDSKQ